MTRIFISHSSADNASALAVAEWLVGAGWTDFFLDIHADRGIVAGERWLQAFMGAVTRCEAVLFLLSPAWCRSRYCTAELAQAKVEGKRIFGLVVEQVPFDQLPVEMTAEWQVCDLTGAHDCLEFQVERLPIVAPTVVRLSRDGLESLARGLRKAGLDPRAFAWPPSDDPKREPYRGLDALEERDAGIFFGRDAALVKAIDRIRLMRQRAGEDLFVVLGASGSGKSSFVRAGLMPRLRNAPEHFVVLPALRPEGAAITGKQGLLACLRAGLLAQGVRLSVADTWRRVLDDGLAAMLRACLPVAQAQREVDPAVVLTLDQAEELFGAEGRTEAEQLLALLQSLPHQVGAPRTLVLCTIRSDIWPRMQASDWAQCHTPVLFGLSAMPQTEFKSVIEGPAKRQSEGAIPVIIEPELSVRLVEDSTGPDALPLLALTLQWLYRHFERDGAVHLRVGEYEQLGGVRGVIASAVQRALESPADAPAIPSDLQLRESCLREVFALLVTVNPETGEALRRIASWAEIQSCGVEAENLVRRLINQRLLRSDFRQADELAAVTETVEVAHEALLRQWDLLDAWLHEHAMQLRRIEELKRAANTWFRRPAERGGLLIHRGEELRLAEALRDIPSLARRCVPHMNDYLLECRKAVEAEREERERQQSEITSAQAKTSRLQKWVAWGLGAGGLVLGGLLIAAVLQTRRVQEQSAMAESRELARLAEAAPDMQERLELAIRSGDLAPTEAASNALAGALKFAMESRRNQVHATDPKGRFVALATAHGLGILVDMDTGRETTLCGGPNAIESLSFSPDGSLLLTSRIRRSKSANPAYLYQSELELQLWQTATGRMLASTRRDGTSLRQVQWAPAGAPGSPAVAVIRDTYRSDLLTIGQHGSLMLNRLELPLSENIVFNPDLPLFLTYGSSIDARGVSLWNLRGERLWASEPATIDWAGFAKGGLLLVSMRSSDLSEELQERQIERLALDESGKPKLPAALVKESEFQWGVLQGASLNVAIKGPAQAQAGMNRELCSSPKVDFRVGRGICSPDDKPPLLLDPLAMQWLGELTPWTFGKTVYVSKFSPDGKTVFLATDRDWLTAWDVDSRSLKWQVNANVSGFWFMTDSEQLLVNDFDNSKGLRILDAKTGHLKLALPVQPNALETEWVDPSRPRVLTSAKDHRAGTQITLWNVETSPVPLRQAEIQSRDTAEFEQDTKALQGKPSLPTQLEIARRRLRTCSAS